MNISIAGFLVLATVSESVWETCKMVWQNGKLSVDRIGAMAVGVLLALSTGTDILALVGIQLKIPYVGMILTGLLVSRGSNFIHDFVKGINGISERVKVENVEKLSEQKDKASD